MAKFCVGCRPLTCLHRSTGTFARPRARPRTLHVLWLLIHTLGDQQAVQACAECSGLADTTLLVTAAKDKARSALVSETLIDCLLKGDLLVCSPMQRRFVCDTILIVLTLTHTLLFHRTRRTKSSNSLRLRSRYSASSVSSVIFCLGALKSCSCSSRASLRICSAVICKRRQDYHIKGDLHLDCKRYHSIYRPHCGLFSAR